MTKQHDEERDDAVPPESLSGWDTLGVGKVVDFNPFDSDQYLDPNRPVYIKHDGRPERSQKNGRAWSPRFTLHPKYGAMVDTLFDQAKRAMPWTDRKDLLSHILAEGILQIYARYISETKAHELAAFLQTESDTVLEEKTRKKGEEFLLETRRRMTDYLRDRNLKAVHQALVGVHGQASRLRGFEANHYLHKFVQRIVTDPVLAEGYRALRESAAYEDAGVVLEYGGWLDEYAARV